MHIIQLVARVAVLLISLARHLAETRRVGHAENLKLVELKIFRRATGTIYNYEKEAHC